MVKTRIQLVPLTDDEKEIEGCVSEWQTKLIDPKVELYKPLLTFQKNANGKIRPASEAMDVKLRKE